ncbi:MAG: nickel-dependent hydrogenase large subunit [Pseudomonadales bacterium]|jgi:coenzyme F420-reducing hydrogenase alpha subunit|nr:nickel-dependent hydrogenase large subunit [Pseudomonadales bacterium]
MATQNAKIDVHHLTRVEGHGNIVVNVTDGTIEKCEWQVPEAPRFFEAMVRGRHYSEVARITSRICGICSVGHTLASLKASECALGIEVSQQTDLLRRVLKHAENFDSHILHVYFLVAPDLLGAPSVFPLVPTHTDVVKRALRMKRLGHEWGSCIGGRTTHPTRTVVGGFASLPGGAKNVREAEDNLRELKEKLLGAVPDAVATFELLGELAGGIPDFTRETEYVGLIDDKEYGLYDGKIGCVMPDGSRELIDVSDYRSVTNEYVTDQATAKFAKHNMDSYMAGALARMNLNYDMLHPEAKKLAEGLGFKTLCFNPYMNSVAQFVEAVHSVYMSVGYIDQLLEIGLKDEKPVEPTTFGRGAGATEVPRGILFHEYEYDQDGFCTMGNCIIPTNQNHGNIQRDFDKLVPELLAADKTEKEMELMLEMLVRAYDPCISCSTHYLDVTFKK